MSAIPIKSLKYYAFGVFSGIVFSVFYHPIFFTDSFEKNVAGENTGLPSFEKADHQTLDDERKNLASTDSASCAPEDAGGVDHIDQNVLSACQSIIKDGYSGLAKTFLQDFSAFKELEKRSLSALFVNSELSHHIKSQYASANDEKRLRILRMLDTNGADELLGNLIHSELQAEQRISESLLGYINEQNLSYENPEINNRLVNEIFFEDDSYRLTSARP